MTARGVARLCGYLAATTAFGFALLVKDATRAILEACRLPRETRSAADLLDGYEAHGWPHEDTTHRDNVAWET